MKNIQVIPTDKPSRLHLWRDENGSKLALCDLKFSNTRNTQNIYITSDEELKKYLDYYLDINTNEVKTSFENMGKYSPNEKKIILTTDQDLIKDGVQAIDDEFLEWFVKNPSCEEVEVKKSFKANPKYNEETWLTEKVGYWEHKIIIPKKNFYCGDKFDYDEQCLEQCETCVDKKGVDYGYLPKEESKLIECYFTPKKDTSSATICDNCGEEKFLHNIGEEVKTTFKILIMQNKETLEEVAEKKEQRMYSREEAFLIWRAGQEYWKTSGLSMTFQEITEQLKNK